MDLATLRRSAGFSRLKVCNALGIGFATLQRWETGKTKPAYDQFAALCRLYGVSADHALSEITQAEPFVNLEGVVNE